MALGEPGTTGLQRGRVLSNAERWQQLWPERCMTVSASTGPRSFERGRCAFVRSSIPVAGFEDCERPMHFLWATSLSKTNQVLSRSISTRERLRSEASSPHRSQAFKMSKNLCPLVVGRRSTAHQGTCNAAITLSSWLLIIVKELIPPVEKCRNPYRIHGDGSDKPRRCRESEA